MLGAVKARTELEVLRIYEEVARFSIRSLSYYRHTISKTKNGRPYLRIVCRKGTFFTEQELYYIDMFIQSLVHKNHYVLKVNRVTGTLSLTITDDF